MRHLAFLAALALASSARGHPPQRVFIERLCPGEGPYQEAVTNKRGEYVYTFERRHLAAPTLHHR
jgi:hypothetical protein